MIETRTLFFVAAAFNAAVVIGLAWPIPLVWTLMGLTPPDSMLFPHLFSALVAVFGLGYFWIALDPARHRSIILLGAVGKLSVFVIGVLYVLCGLAPLNLAAIVTADLIFSVLFIRAYRSL